tara:strand:+ start:278 stop:526 length:249 start_codon:yes stop_codon:yes gene_type:complete
MGFDPQNWCDDDIDSGKKPIKALICTVVKMLELITPTVRFIKTMMEITLELILEANFLTELIIIFAPVIPIAILFGYFFDTL